MKDIIRSFSHPVVAPYSDDYLNNEFGFDSFGVRGDGIDYHLAYEFVLADEGLKELIRLGGASYAILVEASGIFYREIFTAVESGRVKLCGSSISGKVECIPLVIASKDFDGFSPDKIHEDYSGASFDIKNGDVLAIGPVQRFKAEKEYDPLERMDSIMQVIMQQDVQDGKMEVDLFSHRITVHMSSVDYEIYTRQMGYAATRPLLLQTIAMPALVQAIEELKHLNAGKGEEEFRWQTVLFRKMKAMGIDSSDERGSVYIAGLLLEGPLTPSLKSMEKLAEGMGG